MGVKGRVPKEGQTGGFKVCGGGWGGEPKSSANQNSPWAKGEELGERIDFFPLRWSCLSSFISLRPVALRVGSARS